jgi:hypothetical protein
MYYINSIMNGLIRITFKLFIQCITEWKYNKFFKADLNFFPLGDQSFIGAGKLLNTLIPVYVPFR